MTRLERDAVAMLTRYIRTMFAAAECAEMEGDHEAFEYLVDAEMDGRKALMMIENGDW